MLIFDQFPHIERAQLFAENCRSKFGAQAVVCCSQEESNQLDLFPFQLEPPIVLVDRQDSLEEETRIERSVELFGGCFAGT